MVPLPWAIAMLLVQPADPEAPRIPDDYVLRWIAPDECPTADEVHAMVLARHGARTIGAEPAHVDAEVTSSAGDGYTMRMTTRFDGETHTRVLRAPACRDVAESTALVIAVALEQGVEIAMTPAPDEPPPDAATQVPEPISDPAPDRPREPAPQPTPSPAPSDVAPPTDAPTPRPPRARAVDGAVRIAGGGEIGALGVITGAVDLGVAAVWPRARIELHGTYLTPRTRVDGATDSRATFQGGAVAARGCWVPPVRAVEIPLCGGVEAGAIRVATPFTSPALRHTRWGGPIVGLAVLRAIGPVRLLLAVDATVRVLGSRFRIDGRSAFRQLPVSTRWLVGLEFRLGREKSSARGKNRREWTLSG